MKNLSLVALVLAGALTTCPSHGKSFTGAYLGGIGGFKSTSLDKKMKDGFAQVTRGVIKSDFKKSALTLGLSGGYGYQFDNNAFVGFQLDFLLGAGSKKIEKTPVPGTTGSAENKDRFSITPVLQFGYVFEKLMLCKDTLTYFEVGPNFSASKQTLKTTIAGVTRTLLDNSSTTIGLAFGGGVKVAVSEKVIVSLGYRFTQASTKIERKDLKAGHKAHNFLVGIAYKF